jgi:hypothetical protein
MTLFGIKFLLRRHIIPALLLFDCAPALAQAEPTATEAALALQEGRNVTTVFDLLAKAEGRTRDEQRRMAREFLGTLAAPQPAVAMVGRERKRSPEDSSASRIDLALRLFVAGAELKEHGHADLGREAATAALAHLSVAEALLDQQTQAPVMIQILEIRGIIKERLDDDARSARIHYGAAKQRGPAPLAEARLKKLDESSTATTP